MYFYIHSYSARHAFPCDPIRQYVVISTYLGLVAHTPNKDTMEQFESKDAITE